MLKHFEYNIFRYPLPPCKIHRNDPRIKSILFTHQNNFTNPSFSSSLLTSSPSSPSLSPPPLPPAPVPPLPLLLFPFSSSCSFPPPLVFFLSLTSTLHFPNQMDAWEEMCSLFQAHFSVHHFGLLSNTKVTPISQNQDLLLALYLS